MITATIATNNQVTIRQLVALSILPNSRRIVENRYSVQFDGAEWVTPEWVEDYLNRQVAKGRIASFKM